MLKHRALLNLNHTILPFWKNLRDNTYGGYHGIVDFSLQIGKVSEKGVILNSRILWFFSSASIVLKDKELLDYAKHAYRFLCDYCLDKENGGVYWKMNYDGTVLEDIKHTYNQAFAVYSLSAYYAASKDESALKLAMGLFHLIEEKAGTKLGYLEAFTRDWRLISNDKLSENGIIADKTMNTMLHVLEAYTELYRVSKSDEVKACLVDILHIFSDKIYNSTQKRLDVFFDNDFHSLIQLQSYGHDIEASWLLDRACDVVDDNEITYIIRRITNDIVDTVLHRAFVNNSFHNECFNGINDTTRVWWVQAEAVIGLYNKYQQTQNEKYAAYSKKTLSYIENYLVDDRFGGEWFWDVDINGVAINRKNITDAWKCPYHNGRMCLELVSRIDAENAKHGGCKYDLI